MRLFPNKPATFLIIITCLFPALQAQDLFDAQHSVRYAGYLYNNHEYRLSAEEYRRVLSHRPGDTLARLRLVVSLRHLEQLPQAKEHIHTYYPARERDNMPISLAGEYSKILIMTNQLAECRSFLAQNRHIPHHKKQFFMATTHMMEHNWEEAAKTLASTDHPVNRKMQGLSRSAMEISYKKPWLSVGMSAIVPGSGKIYAGQWKDGLISLLFTGMAGWQAYRGFSKNGTSSIYGWIYGATGLGFYAGNLYGSGKAAHQYNYNQNKEIIDAVEDLYIRY